MKNTTTKTTRQLLQEVARLKAELDRLHSIEARHEEILDGLRKSLRESIGFKRALDEGTIFSITNRDGQIIYANPEFCRLSGYSQDELFGQSHRMLNSGYHPREFFHNLWTTISRGHVWHGEIRNKAKDDALFWTHTSIVPLLDETGLPKYYLATRCDVTRQKAFEQLYESRWEFSRCLFNLGGLIFIVLDADGAVRTINRSGCELLQLPEHEVIGKLWFRDFVPLPYRSEARTLFTQLLASHGETVLHRDLPVTTAQGGQRMIAWNLRGIRNDQVSAGVIWLGLDITERQRAARELADSQARLNAVINTTVDGIMTIDQTGVIESFNHACERIFGYTAAEMMGQNVTMLMPSPDKENHAHYLQAYLQTGQKKIIGIGREVHGRRKDGSIFPLYLAVGETKINGEVIFTGILRDLSRQRQAEDNLTKARNELSLQHMRTQRLAGMAVLAGGIAHELNQPLSGINMYAETIKNFLAQGETVNVRKVKKALDGILLQVRRAAQVIDHMRQFASERHSDTAEMVNARTLVEAVTGLVGQQLRRHNISLVNAVDANIFVKGNKTRLEQVLINLIANARDSIDGKRKSRTAKREIRIHSNVDDQQIYLRVADTGAGIPKEIQDRIMEPFVTTKEDQSGMGLGLSICHGILRDYNAGIELEKTSARGTTFRLTFPRTE